MVLHAPTQQTGSVQLDSITAYYDHTWLDYRALWLNRDNLAIHFGYYDASTRSHAAALIRMNQVLAQYAAIQPGQRVLDAGCGIGGSSFWLARNCGVKVVGINVVARQVAHARRMAQARGLTNHVTFQQAD